MRPPHAYASLVAISEPTSGSPRRPWLDVVEENAPLEARLLATAPVVIATLEGEDVVATECPTTGDLACVADAADELDVASGDPDSSIGLAVAGHIATALAGDESWALAEVDRSRRGVHVRRHRQRRRPVPSARGAARQLRRGDRRSRHPPTTARWSPRLSPARDVSVVAAGPGSGAGAAGLAPRCARGRRLGRRPTARSPTVPMLMGR